jgi:hypothetical protein
LTTLALTRDLLTAMCNVAGYVPYEFFLRNFLLCITQAKPMSDLNAVRSSLSLSNISLSLSFSFFLSNIHSLYLTSLTSSINTKSITATPTAVGAAVDVIGLAAPHHQHSQRISLTRCAVALIGLSNRHAERLRVLNIIDNTPLSEWRCLSLQFATNTISPLLSIHPSIQRQNIPSSLFLPHDVSGAQALEDPATSIFWLASSLCFTRWSGQVARATSRGR